LGAFFSTKPKNNHFMMRKFTSLVLVSLIGLSFFRCQDEVEPPASPTFTVNRTSGFANSTEFVFTVNQVGANSISLLPFGTELPNKGGILINPTDFVNGTATIRFSYNDVGTFNAVVVASNFTSDGETIERTISAPAAITITSDQGAISEFSFPTSTSTTITQPVGAAPGTIEVVVPFGTNLTNLVAKFSASRFSTVRVGSTVQESEKTSNNFTSPVTYSITSHNGVIRSYTVSVTVTPAEAITTVKSASGVATSKAAKNASYSALVDNVARNIVVLGTFDALPEYFDSVRVKYALDGRFAKMNIGAVELKQDSLLNLTTSRSVSVLAQNQTSSNYTWYGAIAPRLDMNLLSPLPTLISAKVTGFEIELTVAKGTSIASINTTAVVAARPGTTITGITANGAPFVSGNPVSFTDKKAEFKLSISDTNLGISYVVTYNVKVTVLE
jgi:hypothetical protein